MIFLAERIQDNDIITISRKSPAFSHHVLQHDVLWQQQLHNEKVDSWLVTPSSSSSFSSFFCFMAVA